jgi:hypothetical protein
MLLVRAFVSAAADIGAPKGLAPGASGCGEQIGASEVE